MTTRVLLTKLTTVALLATLVSCGSTADRSHKAGEQVNVVASTNVYGSIAAAIGGDHVAVTSVISDPEQDPHSYEADNQTLLRLSKADVVIENGGGYDDFVDRMLKASKKSPILLNAVDISGHKAPAGGQLNEHVWYDLNAIREIAKQIADAMTQAAPDDASTFSKNLSVFDRQVTPLMNEEDGLKQAYAGTGVGITEPVPLYMLEAVGLVNKTPAAFSEAVEEGDDVSVSVLHQTLELYSRHTVKALVYNEQTSGPITEKVKSAAESAGIPIVPVTETLPQGMTYVTWMRSNLEHLKKALETT
jgi:zinc/manganese transport system substrate-binding protein